MAVARPTSDASPVAHDDIAARLARVEAEVDRLSREIVRLQPSAEAELLTDGRAAGQPAHASKPGSATHSARVLTHIGQALIALGVGYLLRALTDGGLIGYSSGVWIGLAYAASWTGVSAMAARRGDLLLAWFAAALTPLLALPLIVEAALRFELWTSSGAFAVLAAITTGSLVVAVRSRQQGIGWIAVFGAGVVAAVLMVGLRAYVGAALFYIALGVATLWIGYVWEWTLLRWPAAMAADVVVVAVVLRALNADAQQSPTAALAVLLLLLIAYPASILVRTIVLNRSVVLFEVVQSIALLVLLRGALALVPVIGSGRWVLGVSVTALGGAAFGTAVLFGRRARAYAVNVHFYATLGAIVLMVGWAILLDDRWLGAAWGVTALAIAGAAIASRQPVFAVHATLLGLAAAMPSGLASYTVAALAGSGAPHVWPTGWSLASFVLLALLLHVLVRQVDRGSEVLRRGAVLVAGTVCLCTAAGLIAGVLLALVGNASTVRTVVLSAAAVGAAAAGRQRSFTALGWMAYPFLAFVAVKLVAADLRADRPIALFVALAVYGIALITTARLGRRVAD